MSMVDDLIRPNESPYFAMYKLGLAGCSIEEIVDRAMRICLPLREKDIENWKAGRFRRQMSDDGDVDLNPFRKVEATSLRGTVTGKPFDQSMLDDFALFPDEWIGTSDRFFPCTSENKPMSKWGWKRGFTPMLYDYASARAISPCGWVGQNMLGQRMVVMDIDGVGHGCRDEQVIAFGNLFRDKTMCMEDPAKPGSFHLYFSTDRLIPVRHFPWAKLDLIGNNVNAAAYLKNKVSNGLPMAQLDDRTWKMLMDYQLFRKNQRKDVL